MLLAGHSGKKNICFKLETVWRWKQSWSGNSLALETALGWKQPKISNLVEPTVQLDALVQLRSQLHKFLSLKSEGESPSKSYHYFKEAKSTIFH